MKYTIAEIADIIKSCPPSVPELKISRLLTDSRTLDEPSETLFFALTTATNDGHRYVDELYARGVRNFVVAHVDNRRSDANYLVVDDVLAALQTLGRHHREDMNIPVVGITGSRGKTSVKEWLFHLLQPDYRIARSPRSYNSQVGVPLSLWQIEPDDSLALIEAGISQGGEMERLEKMIQPTIGLLTNIGDAHDSGFSSRRDKAREKLRLLEHCYTVIYNADDAIVADAVREEHPRGRLIRRSRRNRQCELFIGNITKNRESADITYTYAGETSRFTLPMTDDADIENALNCLSVMLALDIHREDIGRRMSSLPRVDTRLEVIEAVNDCLMVHDGYTADLSSLPAALDFMHRRATRPRSMTVILSDLIDGDAGAVYQSAASLLRRKGVSRVIGVGKTISANASAFSGFDSRFFGDTAELLASIAPADFHSEFILVKGAPRFALDRVCDMLEARQHETVLEVNIDALIRNYNFFRSKLRPTTGIVCMVKAFGYGAGYIELAKTLQAQGAAYLAVAAHDEGVDLRESGITMPIMVLNPRIVNYRALFDYRLEPEIYSLEMLSRIIAEARKWGIKNYPVHIKLDTGMHRLGFLEEEIPQVVEMLQSQDNVTARSVFSHLAAADDPADDEYTRAQFEYFDRCCDMLQAGFSHHILRHILNSTGIVRFPGQQHDMVRLGIGLYGIRTLDDGSMDALERVSSLSSVIIAIRRWPAGTTIGYNRKGVLKRDSLIATIPIGYADGVDRHLGCGALSVDVAGHRCPIVGRICMDVMMIDVTDYPEAAVGDRVEIFGNRVPAEELSSTLSTITYEILTSVSTRVKRIYYRE